MAGADRDAHHPRHGRSRAVDAIGCPGQPWPKLRRTFTEVVPPKAMLDVSSWLADIVEPNLSCLSIYNGECLLLVRAASTQSIQRAESLKSIPNKLKGCASRTGDQRDPKGVRFGPSLRAREQPEPGTEGQLDANPRLEPYPWPGLS